jgi:hypothetical protein
MKNILLAILVFAGISSYAQTFNGPESVEYDVANSRWLVGQNGSGKVLIYNPANGGLTELCTGMTSGPYGIEILGNVLYCCDGARVRGFDLSTGALISSINLGATFLNGITSDGNNFLFVTDYSAKKIFRVNVLTGTFNMMTTTVKSPNGIIYDGTNNRCVFVTWGGSAAIQAMSLADSTISTLYTTSLSNLDGIIRDQQGNYYVSAWGTASLNKTDANFSANPVAVKTGLSSPADLGINSAGDSIGIPNSGAANNVVFYAIPNGTGINEVDEHTMSVFPNPAKNTITITLDDAIVNGKIELFDMNGKLMASKSATGLVFFIHRDELPSGEYFVNVKNQTGDIKYSRKILFQ